MRWNCWKCEYFKLTCAGLVFFLVMVGLAWFSWMVAGVACPTTLIAIGGAVFALLLTIEYVCGFVRYWHDW